MLVDCRRESFSIADTTGRLGIFPTERPSVFCVGVDIPAKFPSQGYTLDVVALQLKLNVKGKSVRRIMQISEISGIDQDTNDILVNDVFKWNPVNDKHVYLGKSVILEKLGKQYGETMSEIIKDLSRRKSALEWMIDNNIRQQNEVYKVLIEFHNDPIEFANARQQNYDS